jgi:hypothetical protein
VSLEEKSTSLAMPFGIVAAVIILGFAVSNTYGHGLGSETMPPVLLGNRNITLAISESQLTPDSAQSSKIIAVTLYETNTKKPVRDVTFHVIASREDKTLFDHTFQRNDGDLDIDIITTNEKEVKIKEEAGAGWFGQVVGSKSNFAIVTGPIFGSGGLYNFKIEVLTADSYSNRLSPPITYDVGLSIPDTKSYKVTDSSNTEQTIGVITYYDQISNFEYVSQDKSIQFVMPFDWSEKNLSQVSVVHQEIRISKSFGDILSSKYIGYVNDVRLAENSVIIDDYSTLDRLVHIIVNQNDLNKLKNLVSDSHMKFVLQPSQEKTALLTYTKNVEYGITLEHHPDVLVAGSGVTFLYEIRAMPQNNTVSVPFDFSIIHDGKAVFKKHITSEPQSKNKIDVNFPADVTGPIILQFENLGGNSYASADIPLTVKEIAQAQSFPIELFSFSNQGDAKSKGEYQVDMTWFPTDLKIDEDSEFVFTIKDVTTGSPVPNTYYDFVIVQGEKEIFRKSGFTSSGGDYVDYQFANGQEGAYLLRIENIANSTQLVEIPVVVTPEFPLGMILIMALSFALAFAVRAPSVLFRSK